ncbi:unnamed protein product [Discosporangium mesarthrocarpum]
MNAMERGKRICVWGGSLQRFFALILVVVHAEPLFRQSADRCQWISPLEGDMLLTDDLLVSVNLPYGLFKDGASSSSVTCLELDGPNGTTVCERDFNSSLTPPSASFPTVIENNGGRKAYLAMFRGISSGRHTLKATVIHPKWAAESQPCKMVHFTTVRSDHEDAPTCELMQALPQNGVKGGTWQGDIGRQRHTQKRETVKTWGETGDVGTGQHQRRVFDAFSFFNEIDILLVRLEELNPVVDAFILVEATMTHTGKTKPLYFREELLKAPSRFERFLSKIEHVIYSPPPGADNDMREASQRDSLIAGLQRRGAEARDLIVIADLDEIPSRSVVETLKACGGPFPALLQQAWFNYFFNWRAEVPWGVPYVEGVVVVEGSMLGCGAPGGCGSHLPQGNAGKGMTPSLLRRMMRDENFPVALGAASATRPGDGRNPFHISMIHNAGWHMSSFGGVDRVRQRLQAASVPQFGTGFYTNKARLERLLMSGISPWEMLGIENEDEGVFKRWEPQMEDLPTYIALHVEESQVLGMFLPGDDDPSSSMNKSRGHSASAMSSSSAAGSHGRSSFSFELRQDLIRAKLEDKSGYTLRARPAVASAEERTREVMLEVDCNLRDFEAATTRLCRSINGNPQCPSALKPAVKVAQQRCDHGASAVHVPVDVDTRRYLEVEVDGEDVVIAARSAGGVDRACRDVCQARGIGAGDCDRLVVAVRDEIGWP